MLDIVILLDEASGGKKLKDSFRGYHSRIKEVHIGTVGISPFALHVSGIRKHLQLS